MTTGTEPEKPSWRRQWAADLLGVDVNAAPALVRTAFLRRLPEANYMPPAAWQAAFHELYFRPVHASNDPPPDDGAIQEAEEELRAQVDQFADLYWSYLPPERRRHWEELVVRCSFSPPLHAYLLHLHQGLDVVPSDAGNGDGLMVELTGHIQDLYLQRPTMRALARQELLRKMKKGFPTWRRTALLLKKRNPGLGALEPDLMEALEKGSRRKWLLDRSRKTIVRANKATIRINNFFNNRYGLLIAILILGRIFIYISEHSDYSPRNQENKVPTYHSFFLPTYPSRLLPGPVSPGTRASPQPGLLPRRPLPPSGTSYRSASGAPEPILPGSTGKPHP